MLVTRSLLVRFFFSLKEEFEILSLIGAGEGGGGIELKLTR